MSDNLSLQQTLKKHGLFAKKSFGQNFLLDTNITDRIVSSTGDLSGRLIVEIGPGPGGLTRSILKQPIQKLYAIEKDPRFFPVLKDLNDQRLFLYEQDALKLDLLQDLSFNPEDKIQIIANLPYNVGTELLFHWLPHIQSYEKLTLMFQKEVVERMIASPHTKQYGRLSVMVQWLCDCRKIFDLPPSAFSPPPKVTSSVIQITPKRNIESVPYERMEKIVKEAFQNRRKILKSNLRSVGGEELLIKAGIDPQRRAETLSVQDFVNLAQLSL